MEPHALKLVSASAGSGKTHTLTETLLNKIKTGVLNPENLVAVTFTEAGASELKNRIRSVLLDKNLFEEAQKVEEAYISTIHAFGNRLLRELAFDLGLALSTRMLNEDEQTQLIRSSMIDSESLARMSESLEQFGYKTTRKGTRFVSAESAFRTQLKLFIDLLRNTGRQEAEVDFLHRSVEWLEKKYGPVETERTETDLAKVMHRCVMDFLDQYPDCPVEQFGVKAASAVAAFRDSYRALHSAAKLEPLLTDWALWTKLANLKTGFRGSKSVKGFEQYALLANRVVDTANEILAVHPGPLRQGRDQLTGLINGAGETLEGYSKRKKNAKLMDFTDMVASAEQALRNPEIKSRLLDAVQTVVVDEFQDTNPIQFAFLWHLIGAGLDATLVGDVKQSIMGFQGADPRLFKSLLSRPQANVSSLENNWRSQPSLLDVINSLTEGLTSPEGMNTQYSPLGAQGDASDLIPLQLLVLTDKPKSNTKKKDEPEDDRVHPSERVWNAAQIAKMLKSKLESNLSVVDRNTKQKRPLRGSDIVILCPTNGLLSIYAKQLEGIGLAVNLERQDWFDTPEVQLGLQLLSLLANPEDKHARLVIACSELGKLSLQAALECELKGQGIQLPVFDILNSLRASLRPLQLKEIVQAVLERTGLLQLASTWVDASQARANMLKLIGLADEFTTAQPETLASAGFHGRGVETFVGWLHFLKKEKDEDACPRASYNDVDAIELTTWHKSKGREWPIVVVCGLGKSPKVDLPRAGVGYLDFSDLTTLINQSRIEFTPRYDSETKREALAEPLRRAAEQIAMRELYVALSRPREQLVLEWLPCHLDSDKVKIKKRIQILKDLCGLEVGENEITISGKKFAAQVDRVSYAWSPEGKENSESDVGKAVIGRLAIDAHELPEYRVAAQINPSLLDVGSASLKSSLPQLVAYEVQPLNAPIALGKHAKANVLGTLVHRAIELVISGKDSIHIYKQRLNTALSKYLQVEEIDAVWLHAQNLKTYFASTEGNSSMAAEVPVMGSLDGKTVVVGTIDLLVGRAGVGQIIDHKTDSKIDDLDGMWNTHKAQLAVYAGLLPNHNVSLNLVRSGQLLNAKGSE